MWKGLSQRMAEALKGFRQIRMRDDEVFCIAYGSNLSVERMKHRCPGAEVFGTSLISGYRLLFKQSHSGAYATIEQDANCEVPVIIYKITAEDETKLDRFEGFPTYYRKQEFLLPVWCLNGVKRKNRRQCIAYIMREQRNLGEPCIDYYRIIDAGYERWGFEKIWLEKALEDSIGFKNSTAWLKRYRREQHQHE